MFVSNIHNYLKENTKKHHDKVEQSHLPFKLYSMNIDIQEYQDYLLRLYGLHVSIEKEFLKFSEWSSYGFDINSYMRQDLIKKDLYIIDQNINLDKDIVLQKEFFIPSFEESLGYLYVLTGSTMGGQILAKKVRDLFNGTQYQDANNYFLAFGDNTLKQWMTFLNFLNTYVGKHDGEFEKILNGAVDCYNEFNRSLNE